MISRNDRWALLVQLVREVLKITQGKTWLGRTHMQKAAFFAQEIGKIDLGYDFVIYQYGPYSFDLDGDIADLVAVGALECQLVGGYPDYLLGENATTVEERALHNRSVGRIGAVIHAVAREVAPRTAKDLELLSTIAYVKQAHPELELDPLVSRVRNLKPHFSTHEIRQQVSVLAEISERIERN